MSLTVETVWRPHILVVGHGYAAEGIKSFFHEMSSKLFVEQDPTIDAHDVKDITYGRDHRICRLDGSLLIPYGFSNMKTFSFDRKFRALLPATSLGVIQGTKSGFGKGCYRAKVAQTAQLATCQKIPYTLGKSAIEGGNCFLFLGADGRGKAVVGVHSLVLTLLALEEQDYFDRTDVKNTLLELEASFDAPSEDCLRIARNLSFHAYYQCLHDQRKDILGKLDHLSREHSLDAALSSWELVCEEENIKKKIEAYGSEIGYRSALLLPLSDSAVASPAFKHKGIELEAKLALAKQVMAEELKISIADLTIVPQVRFHIDMEVFACPDGKTLIVHDEKLVQDALEAIPNKTPTVNSYLEASKARLKEFGAIYNKIASILRNQGFEVKRLPGIFEAVGEKSCFFMNGVFVPCLKETFFLTNGIHSFSPLHTIFRREFTAQIPNSQVFFVDGEWMGNLMTECEAGIHCLTWEQGKPINGKRI